MVFQVLTDFKYLFSSIDPNALKSIWPGIENKPSIMFQVYAETDVELFHKDRNIFHFLCFVKLFATHRYKYETALADLIIFCDVCIFCDPWQ